MKHGWKFTLLALVARLGTRVSGVADRAAAIVDYAASSTRLAAVEVGKAHELDRLYAAQDRCEALREALVLATDAAKRVLSERGDRAASIHAKVYNAE